ncbi:hypothetical protein [uncultured Cytophaga sp.]|uniref:Ig-like domain-containing protein n=1 Tax=uncultured Cytophaga sp. TaxID=160238 RepID=UPI00261E2F21|nr:hypothetical protein [uncultured Cytophaga sp.]
MSSNANWATGGYITGWRFDYSNINSVNMEIDYLTLTSSPPITSNSFSPSTTKDFIVRYEGICNTTACSPKKTITVNAVPTITGVTGGSRCGTGTVALSATASAGTISWFAALTGGTALTTGTSYSPSVSATTTYYVDAMSTGCTTASRTAVVASVQTPPDASVFGANSWIAYVYNQQNYVAASLYGKYTDPGVSASDPSFNSTVTWDMNGAPSAAASYVGCTVGVDNHSVIYKRQGFPAGTYSLNVLNDDACELFIDGVSVYSRGSWTSTFINAIWTGTLGASSKIEFRWTEATGGSDGAITFVIVPSITSTTPNSRCGTGTVALAATASSGTVNWYTALTGGTSVATGTSYTTPSISTTTTYYVDATNNGATSPSRIAVVATVNTIPTITSTTPNSRCGAGSVPLSATASAGTVNWYTVATGGTSVATGTSYTTPSISTTTTYYVDATNNGCTTASRTSVVATVNAIPTISGTTANSRCGTGTVALSATASAGTISWFAALTGGTALTTGTNYSPSVSTTTSYYVSTTNLGCTSTPRTAVVATVQTPPDTSVFGLNSWIAYVYNQQNYVPSSLYGSYTDPGVSATDPSFNSQTSWNNGGAPSSAATYVGCPVGVDNHSVIYKRQGFPVGTYRFNVLHDDACQIFIDGVSIYSNTGWTPDFIDGIWMGTLGASSKIEFRWTEASGGSYGAITFIKVPTITSTTPNTRCGSGSITLSATASEGTINWYAASTGGSSLASGTSYSPTVSSTATFYVDATNGGVTTPTRTAVIATVNTIPTISGTTPNSRCGTGTVVIGATSSAGTVNWYTVATGGTSVATGTSYTTSSISATTTYYVDATSNGCTTTTRTSVVATVKISPTATAGGSATICSNGTALVSGAGSTNGTIAWTHNGAGSITSGATTLTPVYTAAVGDAGNAVTLTMTVSNSPCTAATATYTVNVKAIPTATAGGSATICSNGTALVSGAGSTNGTIAWTENGAGTLSNATTLTPTYTAAAGDAGNAVTLTMTVSNSPCTAATATYTLNVKAIPTATAGGSATICSNGTATVSGAGSTNGTIAWTENGAGTITAGATTLTPTYTAAAGDAGNAVTLTMTVSNSPCTAATATYTVNVKAIPTATAGGLATICSNGTALVSGAGSTNGTIAWTENGAGAITAGATTLTPTYTAAAGDAGNAVTLTMTVSNSPCTAAMATYAVNVKAIPTATAGGSATICSNGTATVSGAGSTNGTIAWTENGAGTITAGATTLTPTYTAAAGDAGNAVILTMTVSNSPCTAATATYTVNVNAGPTAVAGADITTCSSLDAIDITSGSSASNQASITWTSSGTGLFTNATSLTTATYLPSIADKTAGTVTITLTAIAKTGCSDKTATKTITIQKLPSVTLGSYPSICSGTTATSVAYTSPINSPNQYAIDWSNAANAAGIADVGYTTLSGGTIPLTGLISTSGIYGAQISVRNSTTGCSSILNTAPLCSEAPENGSITLTAPSNGTFTSVTFASYGTPTGTCGNYAVSTCHAANSVSIMQTAGIGKNSFTFAVTNGTFGDPCVGTVKNMKVEMVYTDFTLTIKAIPTITSVTSNSRCGSGTVALSATASAGTINWYAALTGGTSLTSGTNYSPTVSLTTIYYVDATNASCTSASRTAVTATVNTIPTITVTAGSRCGTGTVTLGAVASAGTVNWYAAATGGTALTTGASYTTPSISTTTTYYVDATNTGCTSTPRKQVIATIDNTCPYTWTGATNTAWDLGSNWSLGYVPTSTNAILIPSTVTSGNMPVISTIASVATLTNNGSITLAGSGIFNVYGDINSTGTWTSATGSTLNLVGPAAQSITGVSSVANITINNSAGVSVATAMTVNETVTLKSGVLVTNNKLTINFDNGGNIAYNPSDAGSVVGSVTATRNLNYKTHYIAAPFAGVTSAQVQATTPLFVGKYWKMYTKDFAKQNWTAVITTTQSMPLGTGFSLSLPTAAPLNLSGTYTHGSTFSSEAYSNVGVEKYFMIGNPYPSTLDWDNGAGWTKTNIGGSIYYLNAATSQTASYVSGTATNGGTGYVPAMQSFMVLCTGTGGYSSVSINNNARISLQNPSFWRVASEDIIRIHLTGENPVLTDEAVIRFNESATNMFDFDLDATKIMNGGKYPSVYTREGSSQYSINSYARPDSAKVIPVLAKLVEDGTYTLRFENTNSSIQYVLIDNQLGVEQPITEPYTFVGTSKDSVNRFELQLRESAVTNPSIPTGLQSSNNTRGMQIYSSVKGFILQSDRFVGEAVDIELMDVTGNSVGTIGNKSITSNRTFVPVDLPDGSYIVRVTIGSDVFTGLIVLVK